MGSRKLRRQPDDGPNLQRTYYLTDKVVVRRCEYKARGNAVALRGLGEPSVQRGVAFSKHAIYRNACNLQGSAGGSRRRLSSCRTKAASFFRSTE
jgi:hypothetical protein